jgi:hypothetical protein
MEERMESDREFWHAQRRRDRRRGEQVGSPSAEAARLNRGLEVMEEHDLETDDE